MNILIAYSTRCGTTEKISKMLAEKLNEPPDIIDLYSFPDSDVSNYDLIILGSSVYFGKVQKHFKEFIKNNLNILKEKKLALFLCAGEKNPEIKSGLIEENFHRYLETSLLVLIF